MALINFDFFCFRGITKLLFLLKTTPFLEIEFFNSWTLMSWFLRVLTRLIVEDKSLELPKTIVLFFFFLFSSLTLEKKSPKVF